MSLDNIKAVSQRDDIDERNRSVFKSVEGKNEKEKNNENLIISFFLIVKKCRKRHVLILFHIVHIIGQKP